MQHHVGRPQKPPVIDCEAMRYHEGSLGERADQRTVVPEGEHGGAIDGRARAEVVSATMDGVDDRGALVDGKASHLADANVTKRGEAGRILHTRDRNAATRCGTAAFLDARRAPWHPPEEERANACYGGFRWDD